MIFKNTIESELVDRMLTIRKYLESNNSEHPEYEKKLEEYKEIKNQLVSNYLELVKYISKKYARSHDIEDCMSEGVVGLILAIDSFKEGKRKLSTHIYQYVEKMIRRYLIRNQTIPIPVYLFEMKPSKRPKIPKIHIESYEDQEIGNLKVDAMALSRLELENLFEQLSPKERKIIELVGKGYKYADIARTYDEKRTVSKAYISNIVNRVKQKIAKQTQRDNI
jgi:RNA polymerase sigma factor (sigma-70 family)